jgi:hypothetical protein
MIGAFGNLDGFLGIGGALGELSLFSKASGQPRSGKDRGKRELPKPLLEQIALERCHIASESVYCPTIVTAGAVGLAEGDIRDDLECEIAEGAGNDEGALARLDGALGALH